MIHKLSEEWFDTVLYICLMAFLTGFFCLYWKNEFMFRYSKVVLQEFADETAISGKITKEEYEGLYERLQDIREEFQLEIGCYRYSQQQIFDLLSAESWENKFAVNNVIKPTAFKEYEPQVRQEDINLLRLQTETNASVLAAEKKEYLPLSEGEQAVSVCAVRPRQEVYEGEKLITLCRVTDSSGVYYKEAEVSEGENSGTVLLEVVVQDKIYQTPVEVVFYPRTEQCENGHSVVNTREVLEGKKITGRIICPYCSNLPKYLSCTVPGLSVNTNESINDGRVAVLVTYLDNSTEYVYSDSDEWQDDFDEDYCGIQEVTIRYRNAETKLTVITANPPCTKCGGECNDRGYADYVRYPYCLSCLSASYLFTGTTKEEEEFITEQELLLLLDTTDTVILNRGDIIVIAYTQGHKKTILQQKIRINGKIGTKE